LNKNIDKKSKVEKKVKDEDIIKTVDEVIDSFTNYHLYKLTNKRIIKEIKGSFSSGKESKLFWGKGFNNEDLAIKIFLTSAAEFRKSIKEYIYGDPRFESIPNKFRSLIYLWAKKEFNNLKRMKKYEINVPEPKGLSGNVLVMEFIGESGYRAPLLNEIYNELDSETLLKIYNEVKENLQKMICNANLVHADLSEYNIMYWKSKVYIIDVSQSVDLNHPNAISFLKRDLKNVYSFFSKLIEVEEYEELERGIMSCLTEKEE
jgi:RIO kinase 1